MSRSIMLFMGKCLLTLCLLSSAVGVYAQQRYYCEVKGERKLSSGLKIIFDFGTGPSYNMWGMLSSKLKFVDEQGEVIDFNSMVDAANYMVARGWKFQQAYSSVYSDMPVYHWIFYKDAANMEEAKEGIMTKEEYQELKDK